MSGRRRPRAQKRRGGQPRTLRSRLVVSAVALIAVVCAVIGTVTTIALRQHLYTQLRTQISDAGERLSGPPGNPRGANPGDGGQDPGNSNDGGSASSADSSSSDNRLHAFVTMGPTQTKTIAAEVGTDGRVGKAVVSADGGSDSDAFPRNRAVPLTTAQKAALASATKDGKAHTADIPGLGQYYVMYKTGPHGSYYIALPTESVDNTINNFILIEASITGAGLIAATIAGSVIVSLALRPLRKVAATATRVSELPLHTGEVTLYERVPEAESDPHTEVGQVGAALNRMLDHIHGALHARQQSEMRVRQFVADASHELRTPLASIRGYAELTRRGREETGPDTRHALGRIESEASRMTGLVEDLLLLARLDAGRPLQYEQTDLVPLVIDAVSDARAAGRGHNWRLELPEEPALVSADAARLQQVMVNLFANARTHTPPGTTVTARVHRHGPWLCVDVQDDGPGIPADLLPRVFERFARGDSSRSRSSGSTGLGLAIVQAVAAAHGGAVTVDSVPGRTVFTLHLPALVLETSWQPHSQAQHSATTWVQQGA